MLSITVAPHHSSPPFCHRAVNCRPSPLCSRSIAAAIAPSLAVEELSRRPLKTRSRRAIPCHRGAVVPSIAVKEPSPRTSPSRSHRLCRLTTPATCHAPPRPLVRLVVAPSAGASHCGITFCASHPSGRLSCLLASHTATSYLPASPPLITLSPLVTPLSGLSSGCKASPLLTPPPPICGIIESSQWSALMLV